jgi:cell wall-associated NlpC family hydrolase
VGIYVGKEGFVHAPSSGGRVRRDSLRQRYWNRSFLEGRKVLP